MRRSADTCLAYLAQGGLSRDLGFALLISALAAAVVLDPWTFGTGVDERAASLARQAQVALMRAGFLQLLLGAVLQRLGRTDARLGVAVAATVAGTLGVVAAHVLRSSGTAGGYMMAASALISLGGLVVLSTVASLHARLLVRLMLLVAVGGIVLELCYGLAVSGAPWLYLGSADGVRLRLLRLACTAAAALPLLALLLDELAERSSAPGRAERWGRIAIAAGALGLPASLAAASFIDVRLKYLLPPFADALLLGAVLGSWLARRLAAPLEVWGWVLIAASMGAGLLMGGYAFDGPLQTPRLLGEYADLGRRISRVVHIYAVVFGFLLIIAARRPGWACVGFVERRAQLLLVAALSTPALLVLQPALKLPAVTLAIGPAVLVVASLRWLWHRLMRVPALDPN